MGFPLNIVLFFLNFINSMALVGINSLIHWDKGVPVTQKYFCFEATTLPTYSMLAFAA